MDTFSLKNKNVVITGGTAGIGAAVAAHFSSAGADVVITGRRDSANDVAASIGARAVAMDVSDRLSVESAMRTAAAMLNGRIDTLVLNAGIDLAAGNIDELDVDTFRRVLDTNLFGVVYCLRAGLAFMQAGSSVIVTSSPAGVLLAPGMSAYSVSKAAVNTLVKQYALELGPKGIRINAVLPGLVATEMQQGSTGSDEQILCMTVNGCMRKPAEMAPVFQFLACDAAAPVTGTILSADDGVSAGISPGLLSRAFGNP
ncbi:MAG: SDR family oxidoreductase [Betaproteobacteria bacterium]|nr:SDR family oxidoreductase [Betaproteobacteria bacterium]